MENYDFHPVAHVFPLMKGKEFDDLVKSIKANGLQVPILIYRDMIIDGRNRHRACKEAGVEPAFKTWEGEEKDLLRTIIDLNLYRRHLNTGQRSMIADELAKLEWGRKKSDAQICASPAITQEEAAKALGVSRRSVQKARRLKKTGTSKVVEKVKEGELSLDSAVKIAEEPEGEQQSLASLPKRRRSKGIAPDSETPVKTLEEKRKVDPVAESADVGIDEDKRETSRSLPEEFETKVTNLCRMIHKARLGGWADLPEKTVQDQIIKLYKAFRGVKKPVTDLPHSQPKTKAEPVESAENAEPNANIEAPALPEEQVESAAERTITLPNCFGKLFDHEAKECKRCRKQDQCAEKTTLSS